MLTLVSYPGLFGVADNNPFGLKVYAFLRLAGLAFGHEHVFDASSAPRGQLPYIRDGEAVVGDSDAIIAHVTRRHAVALDAAMTPAQRDQDLLVRRALDDLYWVMSYSRWKDDAFWPLFRDAVLAEHPSVSAAQMEAARAYNAERYRYQGIGRYAPEQAYARGVATLTALANLLPPPGEGFLFGAAPPCSTDAALYGFVANIHFYAIDTPLKACIAARPNLVAHCLAIHARIAAG